MSDLAKTEGGVTKTALEYRDEYLINEVKYENFYCPFCNIPLIAKAIYIEGVQKKSPHFGVFPSRNHLEECDGYPMQNNRSLKAKSKRSNIKIGGELFEFPEKFTTASPPQPSNARKLDTHIKAESIEKKRKAFGAKPPSHKYTSSLLQSFVKSRAKIFSVLYGLHKKNKANLPDRSNFISQQLATIPLELNGNQLNYNTAFRNTKYFTSKGVIWEGKGEIRKENKHYVLTSNEATTNGNDKANFRVVIPLELFTSSGKKSHLLLKETLEEKKSAKWFCYGSATHDKAKRMVVLTPSNLNHIFLQPT